ncbi:MAG: Asp23/Gls24 family envelope stress response protein [Clostridia bacterium]|nr:Asp23/Gls24 family envelope stress response protein [Clostridia bacterium]
MITLENHLGTIDISQNYFSNLIGNAVSSCYGVAVMVKASATQSIRSLITRRSFADDGIRVRSVHDKLVVDLHIAVIYGMNISAISSSIVNKVTYTVEKVTGLEVLRVNVFVDAMKGE